MESRENWRIKITGLKVLKYVNLRVLRGFIIKGLKAAKKKIIPHETVKINRELDEFFLISFPKCGRTWLRMMIGKVFEEHFKLRNLNIDDIIHIDSLYKLNPNIPKITVQHDENNAVLWQKSEELERSKIRYKSSKVIFLVRDPRDVIVSSYFHRNKRGWRNANGVPEFYKKDITDLLHEERGGFDTIIEFYNIWTDNRHIPKDFLFVRYEDLHQSPVQELQNVMRFLGFPSINSQIITRAVAFASFENMRNIERSRSCYHSKKLVAADKNDPESYKTRKGKVGGFREYLSEEEIRFLNEKMKRNLSPFCGYVV